MDIRNFSIIAHIDHGKSTLADRMLEITGTIEKRRMKEQVLDRMDLERERGITIKMTPVTMLYKYQRPSAQVESYILNLIDTPGHIDFSYEVSRALKAVEGTILLVDATQGVQAQTLTTLRMAQDQNIVIVPVLSKIDSQNARIRETEDEVIKILNCKREDILRVSGKTGEGVRELLNAIILRIPPPTNLEASLPSEQQALVFDFKYSNHRGLIVYIRMFGGEMSKGTELLFKSAGERFTALEVGIFSPEETPKKDLKSGEIGYIVTGIKKLGIASVGDTIVKNGSSTKSLPGYQKPKSVIWASIFPESQPASTRTLAGRGGDDFSNLKKALELLNLSDSSLYFTEESSGVLGRGFRCGFLGMLHLEIIMERLKREYNLELVITSPSITYEVTTKNGKSFLVYSATHFPDYGDISGVKEQWVNAKIITPIEYINGISQILYEYEAETKMTENFGDGRTVIEIEIPLRELMRNFFDDLKRVSSGYASLSYEPSEIKPADVVKLEILVTEEVIPAFSKIVSKRSVEREAKLIVDKLYKNLPRQLTKTKIQARALGRILSSKTLSATNKDVAGYLYGGDITRKMKLREKQKKGKKKMQQYAKANIPHDVFLKIIRG